MTCEPSAKRSFQVLSMPMSSDETVGGMFKCCLPEPFARLRADGGEKLSQSSFRNG